MKRFAIYLLGVSVSLCGWAQTPDWNRAEKLSADTLEQYMSGRYIYPTWIEGSSSFYYDVKTDGGNRYYLVDARNGRKQPLIADNARFASQYAAITGDSLDTEDFQVYGITFRKGNTGRFYLNKKGKQMVYDVRSGKLSETVLPEEGSANFRKRTYACHSADSLFTMMGSGYDLYVRDNRNGTVRRITTDGKEDAAYTSRAVSDTLETVSRGFWLGHRYVYLMSDMSEVKELGFINSLASPRPQTVTFKMPMPGDEGVRRFRLFWYNADTGEARMLPIDKYPDQVVEMDYFRSDEALFITRRSRKADRIDLCRINVQEGVVTELISEECLPHMNLSLFNCRIFDEGKRILWWSERTGRGNYYLYDGDGQLLNRVTQGDNLVAGNIVHIDTLKNEIIFAGYGNEPDTDPSYAYYYKASLNGRKQVLLTPGDGNHELSLSPDRRYAIDKYSRVDLLPVVRVLSIDRPQHNYEVECTDGTALRRAGWRPPVRVRVKAADGETDLYGVMYLPSSLDSTRRYPVISNVYPGPQDDQLPRSFVIDDNGNQSLAELGFVVVNVAPRGSSPLRGRDFHCFGYGNLRDYPLADSKHVIEELARRYPFIDLNRVGIYGHSGGAFQTVASMLTYPDFYKVGVAASGNHDNNIYIQWWGEVFHGLEQHTDSVSGRTTFSVKIPTNQELAPNLKGRLMLITGDVDKNVPPSSTYRLADALIKAGKRFDMFVLPGKDHGVMCPYYQNLIRYYFVENLLQPSPRHIDIINHQ